MKRRVSPPPVGFGRSALGLLGLLGVLGATACQSKQDESSTAEAPTASAQSAASDAVQLSFQPKADQLSRAATMASELGDAWTFDAKAAADPNDAPIFLHLAATSPAANVKGAALLALAQLYSKGRKLEPDDDFVNVVIANLEHDEDRVAARAMLASRAVMGKGKTNQKVLDAVVNASRREEFRGGPPRLALLDAIVGYGVTDEEDKVFSMYTDSLDAEHPYVIAQTLRILSRRFRRIPNRAALFPKLLSLTQHEAPIVRGMSFELLGLTGTGKMENVVSAALGGLKDNSGFVRSESARALGRLNYRRAIHELMALVDDEAVDYVDIQGWRTLEGVSGRMRTRTAGSGMVRESALTAIANLAGSDLTLDPMLPNEPKTSLDKNAKKVKAWYAKAKGDLPQPEIAAADQARSEAAPTTTQAAAQKQAMPASATQTPPASSAP